ncbi:MAG: HNH endonuclease [Desulfobacteraceae bacterium]
MQERKSRELNRICDFGLLKRLIEGIEVDPKTGCWLWQNYTNKRGYGQIWYGGKARLVHRISYAIFVGPIEEELTIHHNCFVPNCCNPDHLELKSHEENCGIRKGKDDIPI